ncbi:MAG: hypothetical protein ING33_07105 [Rhodocyclaceae bacterium]|nr:hypothetical protein [Rhodocyclaceae bacterium]
MERSRWIEGEGDWRTITILKRGIVLMRQLNIVNQSQISPVPAKAGTHFHGALAT